MNGGRSIAHRVKGQVTEMALRKRRSARDMLDPSNEWSSPPACYTRSHCSRLPSFPSLHTGPSPHLPVWVSAWSWTRFLGSPLVRTSNLHLLRSDQAAFHHPHFSTFSRTADGRPFHSGPWLTSSYSRRLDGRRRQYRNPRARLFLSFVQNRHKLVSLPQEAADYVQIPLFAVPERFVHRALWPVRPSSPIGSRSVRANHAHFKRVTCSRWRGGRHRQYCVSCYTQTEIPNETTAAHLSPTRSTGPLTSPTRFQRASAELIEPD